MNAAAALWQVGYRAGQFVRGFRTTLSPEEIAAARRLLGARELQLFAGLHPRDRRHSMNVMRWLEASTRPSRELLVAALLHDVGKGQLRVLDRVAYVTLNAISPQFLDGIAREHGPRWRQGLWRLRHHARLGAERLIEAGSSPRVVELVAAHIGTDGAEQTSEQLTWLRSADAAC